MNENDLEREIRAIDEKLKKEDVPIHARPIRALSEYSIKFKISLPITEPRLGMKHDSDDGWPISSFIFKWFDRQYGERLKVHPGPGKSAFILRNDAWVITYPKLWGSFIFAASKEIYQKDLGKINGRPVLNIIEYIDNFPSGLRESLEHSECEHVLKSFSLGIDSLSFLDYKSDFSLLKSATSDIEAAVSHLFSTNREYGLSKWASLQATEKFLKALIEVKGEKYERVHKLCKLKEQLSTLGVNINIDKEITEIQCEPSIRYGEDISLASAVSAHQASLLVISKLKEEF
jgi:HEPN domain-containing protein